MKVKPEVGQEIRVYDFKVSREHGEIVAKKVIVEEILIDADTKLETGALNVVFVDDLNQNPFVPGPKKKWTGVMEQVEGDVKTPGRWFIPEVAP